MPSVTYISFDGARSIVEIPEGENVMRGAVYNGIEGIIGECGGGLACATCHCYIGEPWLDKMPAPSGDECALLESAAEPHRPNSRLSCQVVMTPELDGLTVHMPEHQY